jgi:sporulation protein YlmC with PRC-barrel domain
MRVELGIRVRCKDAELGELADVVIDPAERRVTHLVVQPWPGALVGARLVPAELIEPDEAQGLIALACTKEEFAKLDSVREFSDNVQPDGREWDVGVVDVIAPPSSPPLDPTAAVFPDQLGTFYDRIPKDEVEIRRSSTVHSPDRRFLGHVQALVVDEQDRVTHFVLRYRRLLRPHNVKVPVSSIKEIGSDTVTIALTREQVRRLPADSPGRR